MFLPYDPKTILLGIIHPKELKAYIHTQKNLHMDFRAAFFIIPKTWKQPRCLSISKRINGGTSRQWNVVKCEKGMSHQTVKRHVGTLDAYYWVKKSQSLKATCCMIPTVWHMENARL